MKREWERIKTMEHFEHIKESAKRVRMNPERKREIRGRLLSFMEKSPVMAGEATRLMNTARFWSNRPEHIGMLIKRLILSPMPIALIIALLLGGGAAAAAENTLPGDVLYPVKVEVNERVRGWVAVSDDAEARLQVDLAARRLEEAEKLAKDGRLDADVRAKIEANFDDHAARVASRIEAMQSKSDGDTNAVELTSRFEASLRAHEEILKRLAEEKGDDGSVASIAARVASVSDTVDAVRTEAETGVASSDDDGDDTNKVDRKTAAERAQKRAEQKIKDVKAFFEKPSAAVAPDAEAREKIALAEKLLESGKEYMKLGAYGKAFVTFQESWNVAQKAWIVLNGSIQIGITDPATPPQPGVVPSPGVVPPSPSVEGEAALEAEKRISQAASKISEVRRFLSIRMGVMTEETAKKVEAQLVAAEKALGEAKNYFSVRAYAKAIVMARESKELAEFALKIAVGGSVDPSVPPTSGGATQIIQKVTPSGEVEIEIEDRDGSGKFR